MPTPFENKLMKENRTSGNRQNAIMFGYKGPNNSNIQGKAENASAQREPHATMPGFFGNMIRMSKNMPDGNTTAMNAKFTAFAASAVETPSTLTTSAHKQFQAVG